ncbi:MAG: MalM family protein [Betaproteobacteria bacterium]
MPLELDKPNSVRLGAGSSAFEFSTGKSYFHAARLPSFSGPVLLTIESEGTVAGEGKTSVFRPEVLLLDENFQVTRQITAESFKRNNTAALSGSVFVNSMNAADTYIIVFTRSGAHAGSEMVKTFTPQMLSLGGPAVTVNGTENSIRLSYGPEGLLTLLLRKYEPKQISR